MPNMQSRRRFLSSVAATGAASILCTPPVLAAEGALETTAVRLAHDAGICLAPMLACEQLLREEGFSEIRFVPGPAGAPVYAAMSRGELDFGASLPPAQLKAIDAGMPVTVIGGIHVGCYELFANGSIRSVVELKGKAVGLQAAPRDLLTLMAAHVGLDPVNDIHWVTDPKVKPLELFAQGKIDGFLGFPPEPQELRARNAGHVILSTAMDRPWSEYFCCMIAASSEFLRAHPVATKRVLRAILKTADLCATEPIRVARQIVDGGFTPQYDYALQTLKDVRYNNWREYDAEDTIRFYALRLNEVRLIKSTPKEILANGTDWRFLNELKRELKA